jgi:hypothetical protein
VNKFDIRIGDRVRSYDFLEDNGLGDPRYYIEGTVMAMGWFDGFPDCPRYKIKVEGGYDPQGPFMPRAEYIYPPMNGVPSVSHNYCFGVERL